MTEPRRPRLPFAPLLELSGASNALVPLNSERWIDEVWAPAPIVVLAEMLDLKRGTVQQWCKLRSIPYYAAERACEALALHPCEVWGDLWIAAVEAAA